MTQPKIIVVGGGLAGLMATIRVAESGVPVEENVRKILGENILRVMEQAERVSRELQAQQ